jgi:hypothetical protein
MSEPTPSLSDLADKLADELAVRIMAEADAWATAQLLEYRPDLIPAAGMLSTLPASETTSYALAQLRFACRVIAGLKSRLDRLADEARKAGASETAVAIAAGRR